MRGQITQLWTNQCTVRRTLHSASMLRVRMTWQQWCTTQARFLLVCIIRAKLPCLCSDTLTILVVSGTMTQQKEFEEKLSKHLISSHVATLRSCTALGDVTEVRILNRIVRWVELPSGSGRDRVECEADPRHAELVDHTPTWTQQFISKCVYAQ